MVNIMNSRMVGNMNKGTNNSMNSSIATNMGVKKCRMVGILVRDMELVKGMGSVRLVGIPDKSMSMGPGRDMSMRGRRIEGCDCEVKD